MPKRKTERPERLVSYVRPQLKRAAEEAAAELGISTSVLVGLALRAYLAKQQRGSR